MKLLCSADYHIKLKTKNIPDTWAKNRFLALFDKLHELEQTVDIHCMMGDFFDRLPTLEELELYYTFIVGCKCRTYIIPGNHEALKKNTTFFTFLKDITTRLNSLVTVVDDYMTLASPEPLIDFIPYNRLKEFDPKSFAAPILITHVRGEIPPHVKAEIDLSLFDRWGTVLAGDLHSYENSQRNIIYPGSPITTSFHRKPVDTGVVLFDTNTSIHEFIPLGLPQLIRKTIEAGDPMPATNPDHTIYEITGDMSQLSDVDDNELLDKKVVKRNTDTALILSPEMTMQEEMVEYLNFVLMLPEETINDVIKVYHDTTKTLGLE